MRLFLPLLAVFLLFAFVQRTNERWMLQGLANLFKNKNSAIFAYHFLFFPGVLLHEGAHFLTAMVLGVRVGRFNLLPKINPQSNVIEMGSVETYSNGFFRDALIGVAPLVFGSGVVIFLAGLLHLDRAWTALANLQFSWFWELLVGAVQTPYALIWFWLMFVVSSTMMPSEPDRRSWFPVLLIGGIAAALLLVTDNGWVFGSLLAPVNWAARALTLVFVINLIVHLVFLAVLSIPRVIARIC